jgi:predicted DNA-binding transcriptional regulator YafY
MRFWILQFGRYVKVFEPQSLCDIIKKDIVEMQKSYEE